MAKEQPIAALGKWVLDHLSVLPTKFGVFLSLLESASTQGAEPSHLNSDLLPILPGAIANFHKSGR